VKFLFCIATVTCTVGCRKIISTEIKTVLFCYGATFMIDDWLLKHIIGHIRDGFLRVKWPNQQCQSTEGESGL